MPKQGPNHRHEVNEAEPVSDKFSLISQLLRLMLCSRHTYLHHATVTHSAPPVTIVLIKDELWSDDLFVCLICHLGWKGRALTCSSPHQFQTNPPPCYLNLNLPRDSIKFLCTYHLILIISYTTICLSLLTFNEVIHHTAFHRLTSLPVFPDAFILCFNFKTPFLDH